MDGGLLVDSVQSLRERMRCGSLSATELVAMSLDAIRARDPEIGAFVEVLDEQARREAALVRQDDARPLAGIPVAVKENRGVAGARLEHGSRALVGHRSTVDGPAVARLRAAGAIIVGTTAMSEFGLLPGCESAARGPTSNPLSVGLSTGGSSGGSAAAVAAGMVPLALGNDAGGSLRIPAAWCGLATLVTAVPDRSHGATSAHSVDGLLARRLADVLLGQSVLDGGGPEPAGGTADTGAHVVLLTAPPQAEDAWQFDLAIVHQAAARLDRAGTPVAEGPAIWSDPASGRFFAAVAPLARRQVLSALAEGGVTGLDDVEEYTRSFLDHAGRVTPASRARATEELARWSTRLTRQMGAGAVLLCPTTLAVPPRIGELTGTRRIEDAAGILAAPTSFTWLANALGWWSAALPVARAGSLPGSVQVMAPAGNAAALLSVCRELAGPDEPGHPWMT